MRPPDRSDVIAALRANPEGLTTRQVAQWIYPKACEYDLRYNCTRWVLKKLQLAMNAGCVEVIGKVTVPSSGSKMNVWRLTT